jgi:hypothetical protein
VSDHTSPSLTTTDLSRAPVSTGSAGHLRRARWIATVIWLSATGIQLAVWAAICVATVSVDPPWWLWTFLPGAAVVGVLGLFETDPPSGPTPSLSRSQNGSDQ